ncbi:MAG TPA: DnaJ family domain-containing protein, partial [Thermodesulfovibrionales bacterium]|nr:DnaJ family domain-containing protein [Thermodesulfovibrionales bacterium]
MSRHPAKGIEGKTVDIFAKIAEERIRRAIEDEEFANLPNAGKPLTFDDETWIPEDMRLSYRILKNAGCIPPELEKRREILNLKVLLDTLDDDKERMKKLRELNFRMMEFNIMKGRPM